MKTYVIALFFLVASVCLAQADSELSEISPEKLEEEYAVEYQNFHNLLQNLEEEIEREDAATWLMTDESERKWGKLFKVAKKLWKVGKAVNKVRKQYNKYNQE